MLSAATSPFVDPSLGSHHFLRRLFHCLIGPTLGNISWESTEIFPLLIFIPFLPVTCPTALMKHKGERLLTSHFWVSWNQKEQALLPGRRKYASHKISCPFRLWTKEQPSEQFLSLLGIYTIHILEEDYHIFIGIPLQESIKAHA